MRITLNMQTDQSLLTLNNQQEKITQLSQEISSGVKLSSASDDPYAWSQVMNVKQGMSEYNSILSGINFATGWDQATESSLNELSDLVSQAQQVAITASSANSTSQNAALVSQVNGILQQAVTLANSQYGDQYIFSGTNTTEAPYSIDSSTGVVTPNPNSNSDPILVKTSTSNAASGGSTVINLTGDQVFNYTSGGNSENVLNAIWSLGQAIQNGDSAAVSSSLTTLNDAYNHVNNELTVAGSMLSSLTSQQSAITTIQTNEQSTLSNLQDTDVATATTQLTTAQTAFQAALKVVNNLESLNLASYLSGTA